MAKPVDFESATSPGVINLGPGQPSADLLPTELLQEASRLYFAAAEPQDINYGPKQGDPRFREALARLLTKGYAAPVDAGALFLTAGNSQALDLVCERFTQPGDLVFVEEPTYFLAYRIFRDHGLRIVSIPMDGQGMDMDAFESRLEDESPRLVYTIPSFHNPTGQTMTLQRRERLAALSLQHDFLVAADEVYQLLHYGAAPPPPLGAWSNQGQILSLGTFSKILAPGTRLGWIQTGEKTMNRLLAGGAVSSGGSYNHLVSHIVRCAMDAGLQDQFILRLRDEYRARLDAMDAALHEHLGEVATWQRPDGGYFVWLELKNGRDAATFLERAQALDTGFMPGNLFSLDGGLNNFLRLSIAPFGVDDICTAVEVLGRVFRENGSGLTATDG